MRKFGPIIVGLVFGITAGIGASELWLRARTIPYCEVARNGDSYHMRYVRVKARLFFSADGMSVYEECDPTEALAASVELEGGHSATDLGYVHEVSVTGEKHYKVAEAIIEGEFDAEFSTGCWGPKYHITARQIELVSSVEDYVVPPVRW